MLPTLDALPRRATGWLPTYAPWRTPIEKLWRWLTGDVRKPPRLVADWVALRHRGGAFRDQVARGATELLRSIGLRGAGQLAHACHTAY